MSKSKYPKWFNPTGVQLWDSYYEFFWGVIGISILLIAGVIVGAVVA